MAFWALLPQSFPAPIFIQENEITRAKDCKSYCSVCCWGYICAWILILCLTAIFGSWLWILIEVNYYMPQTFAWENLLRTFGSAIYLQECANMTSTSKNVIDELNGVNCWTAAYTVPCVPIIAILILTMTIINGIWCLLPVSLLNLYNAVLNLRANLAWHLFFFLISITIVPIYFAFDLLNLRSIMETSIGLLELGDKNYTISPRWDLTQSNTHCCGVDSFKDWKLPTGTYPASCCNSTKSDCSGPVTVGNVFQDGCFNSEYNTVLFYGGSEIILIWITYFTSLGLYKLIVSLSLRQYEEARTEGDASKEGPPPDPNPTQTTPLLTKNNQ